MLVPEIALALPLVDRLRADLDARVALVHSGLGDGERADEWRRIRPATSTSSSGRGWRSLAPLADVGLIIVDEEHDAAYKSDRTPRLQARDVAIALAGSPARAVVLGSATPAVESIGRARTGDYDRVVLPARPVGAAADGRDRRPPRRAGGRQARPAVAVALGGALAALDTAAGEQAILVLNRRGTASVVLCRDCGYVQACPDCERPLVYHQAGTTLRCHHCGRATPARVALPGVRLAADPLPRRRHGARRARGPRHASRRCASAASIATSSSTAARPSGSSMPSPTAGSTSSSGRASSTKGLDIPSVTLVGIVSSDVALNLPDERAAERTYQLLAQAIGRAGRGERPGRAILQTYQPEHPAIVAAADAATGPPSTTPSSPCASGSGRRRSGASSS